MRFLLVVYDDQAYIPSYPLALAYIAAVLRENNIEVVVYNQDIHHHPDEHLTKYLDENKFDFLGMSIVGGYYQYKKLLSLSNAINESKNRPYFVIGGHGPTPEPEFYLKRSQADCVVMGEGEVTVINLVNAIKNKTALSEVKGIAYREGDKVYINERQPVATDLDTIPWPAHDLFNLDVYRYHREPHCDKTDFVGHVLSTRGCFYKCNFCYRLDPGFRGRSGESIVEEVKWLKKDFGITYIGFNDELLMSNKKRTIELCEAFIKGRINIKWSCNGRLNVAIDNPEVLKLMKEAGCVFINYGIESMDDEILKVMKKCLTTKTITAGIEETLAAGISPGFNILFGNIGETKETLQKGVDFLLKYDDGSQLRTIRPVCPYPGSPLYYIAQEKGLLSGIEDFYDNKHLNSDLLTVNFTDMSDEEYHSALLEANSKLLSNYYKNKLDNSLETCKKLYLQSDVTFRGFR